MRTRARGARTRAVGGRTRAVPTCTHQARFQKLPSYLDGRPLVWCAVAGLSRESFALFVEPHWDDPIGVAERLHALHIADAANDDVIPPLARRLKKLPVEFGQFLEDSFVEYYSRSQES